MKLCADVFRNVSSMPVDRDTSRLLVLSAWWARKHAWNNRVSRQMWSACCNSIPLFGISDEECWQCSAAYCRCNKESPETFSMGSVWSSAQTWLPVIFISFLVWHGRRRTTFWHNELQTSVDNWLKAQAAGFYDESIGKLAPRYEKYLRWSVDYVEKLLVVMAKCCK